VGRPAVGDHASTCQSIAELAEDVFERGTVKERCGVVHAARANHWWSEAAVRPARSETGDGSGLAEVSLA
jgi:hypothetical protein